MNPLSVFRALTETYDRFVHTYQTYKNPEIAAWMRERVEAAGFLWREPYLTLRRRTERARPWKSSSGGGVLHPEVLRVFRQRSDDPSEPPDPPLPPPGPGHRAPPRARDATSW
ncbi:MAG: hypothetical protein KatS3mg014_2610 [Actinomycetota bacterium]|nr:MAG: hypothetical protein KatS3mg014_2610 [Actinomycetota bacterium]